MKIMSRILSSKAVRQYAMISVGCVLGAASYPLFLQPNQIAPGGLTGVTTILNFYTGLPIGLGSLILNVPLFMVGWRIIGMRFIIRTLISTLLFSSLIDLLKLQPLSMDPMLASVFGGVLLGAGLALIMRGNATTGGTDLLARIVHHHQRGLSVGTFLFSFDLFVILAAWIFLSAQHAMYAIICVFVSARVLDQVLVGIGTDKACYVISRESGRIEKRVMGELERGVTRIDAAGAYSGRDIKMLLCVVGRFETVRLKQIVQEEDPNAFMFITDTHETLGEGFAKLTGEEI